MLNCVVRYYYRPALCRISSMQDTNDKNWHNCLNPCKCIHRACFCSSFLYFSYVMVVVLIAVIRVIMNLVLMRLEVKQRLGWMDGVKVAFVHTALVHM